MTKKPSAVNPSAVSVPATVLTSPHSLLPLTFVNDEPRMDSRIIASELGVEHKNTRELLEQYQSDFEEFGVVRFETAKPPKGSVGGRPEKFYYLNEDQVCLLLTYSQNTAQARALKKNLIRAFTAERRKIAALAYGRGVNPLTHVVRPMISNRSQLSFRAIDPITKG